MIYAILFFLSSIFTILFTFTPLAHAFDSSQAIKPVQYFEKGIIISEHTLGQKKIGDLTTGQQQLVVKILEGKNKDKIVSLLYEVDTTSRPLLHIRDTIIITQTIIPGKKSTYYVYDQYRFDTILLTFGIFLLLIIITTGKKGIGAIIGLGISLYIICSYMLPHIIAGEDPLWITTIGSFMILFLTTYLAHGFSKQTTVALLATFCSLLITIISSYVIVQFTSLTGYGSEDAYNIHFLTNHLINIKGLFLGSIIITTLGALNDVTITQSAAIFSLAKVSLEKHTYKYLLIQGFAIGREHVLSLINTLILAYAGSSLPLFLFFIVNPLQQPYWAILSNEFIAEEIIKSIAGTFGLILAVPLVTILAVGTVYAERTIRMQK